MDDEEDILNEVIGSDVLFVTGDVNIVVGVSFDLMSLLFDGEEEEEQYEEKKQRKKRAPQKERHPELSRFMKYIDCAKEHKEHLTSIWDEDTWEGRQFHERFCVPYAIFNEMVEDYETGGDKRCDQDIWGHNKSDTRLLILGALRVLSQVIPFDLVDELTDIHGDTHCKFLKTFCRWMTKEEFPKWVKLSSDMPSVRHVMDYYEYVGIPGSIGSVDCVHLAWDMCPAGLLSDCKGKEGYLMVVFQVVTSHTRKILAVSGPYYGTWNDKTISRHDENV